MPSPPKIRRYIPADRDATLAIWLEASRVGHGFLGEAELQKQKALVRDHYLDASETWLALDGDTPLGFIEQSNGGLACFAGGMPLGDAGGSCLGGVGVSGASAAQDQSIAEAAVAMATIQR